MQDSGSNKQGQWKSETRLRSEKRGKIGKTSYKSLKEHNCRQWWSYRKQTDNSVQFIWSSQSWRRYTDWASQIHQTKICLNKYNLVYCFQQEYWWLDRKLIKTEIINQVHQLFLSEYCPVDKILLTCRTGGKKTNSCSRTKIKLTAQKSSKTCEHFIAIWLLYNFDIF